VHNTRRQQTPKDATPEIVCLRTLIGKKVLHYRGFGTPIANDNQRMIPEEWKE